VKQTVDALVERAKVEAVARTATMRFGPVVATGDGVIFVRLDGEEVGPVPVLNGGVVDVDDQAWMLQQGSTLVCFGGTTASSIQQPSSVTTADVQLTNPVGRFSATTQEDANIKFVEEIDRRVGGDGVTNMVYLTQDEFDQITPDPQTVYVIED